MKENWRVGEFKTRQLSLSFVKGENKIRRIQSCVQYIHELLALLL